MSEKTCFHCGEPVDPKNDYPIGYNNEQHSTCCPGCQAVAQSIINSGLGQYYEQRTKDANKAQLPPQEILDQIKLYDLNEVQKDFVTDLDGDKKEAVLMLDGITCSACVWLIEQKLNRTNGVVHADLNYTTHRARVQWDASKTKLSDILLSVKETGYNATPYDPDKYENKQKKERRSQIFRLWVAGLSMMQVMMYAVPTYIYRTSIEDQYLWVLYWASMILTLPVVLYSAFPFYVGFIRDIKNKRAGMDTPIALAVIIAFIGSSISLFLGVKEGVFFDSISMFVFLLLAGRYLEQSARRKATDSAERLVKLVPSFCHLVDNYPQNHSSQEAVVAMLKVGDVLMVKPGETIPVDGVILEGETETNEAMLTGESLPIAKSVGSSVIAGSINLSGTIFVKTEQTGDKTRLGSIVRLLDKALGHKPKIAELADRYASGFISFVVIFAIVVFGVWFVETNFIRALTVSISLLVITCPCALSLATPTSLTAATGNLTDKGLLISNGHTLQTLTHVNHIVFDKTGTLTEGNLTIHGVAFEDEFNSFDKKKIHDEELKKTEYSVEERQKNYDKLSSHDKLIALALAMEEQSEHPIAKAFSYFRNDLRNALPSLSAINNNIGQGIRATFDGETYRLGRLEYAQEIVGDLSEEFKKHLDSNSTVIALAKDGVLLALFFLSDTIKQEAYDTISRLKALGYKTTLLSGDRYESANEVAKTLQIDNVKAQATPEDKLHYVQKLQQEGNVVLMVGDGVNDAPVLALADVSIAMDSGADASQAGSDIIMISQQLNLIINALKVAKKTQITIRENFAWAGIYNCIALPLAALGYATPELAALGMSMSSILVVLNSLRLLKVK